MGCNSGSHLHTKRDTIYGMFILFCLCVCLLCVVMLRNKHTHTHILDGLQEFPVFFSLCAPSHISTILPFAQLIKILQNKNYPTRNLNLITYNFLCASHKLYYTHNRKYYMQTLWSFSRAHFPLETN